MTANARFTMSILDKVVAAVTPRESEQARVEARAKAHDAAEKGSWFAGSGTP
jgi:hypothetical protein